MPKENSFGIFFMGNFLEPKSAYFSIPSYSSLINSAPFLQKLLKYGI